MKVLAKEQVKILKHTISANENRIKQLEALIGKLCSSKVNQDFSISSESEDSTVLPDMNISNSKSFKEDLENAVDKALDDSERNDISMNEERVGDDQSVTGTVQDPFLPTVAVTEKKEIASAIDQDNNLFQQEDSNQVGTSNAKALNSLAEEVKNGSNQDDWHFIDKTELLDVQSSDLDMLYSNDQKSNDKSEMLGTYTDAHKRLDDIDEQKVIEGSFGESGKYKIECDSTNVITVTETCRSIQFADNESVVNSSNFENDETERSEILLREKSAHLATNIEISHDDDGNKIIDKYDNEHQVTHGVSNDNADEFNADSNDDLSDIDEEAIRREVEERIRREVEIRVRKEIEERRRKRKSVKSMIE